MVILDTNVLLYAHVSTFDQHIGVNSWLEDRLSQGSETIGILWQVVSSFLRISTNRRIFEKPLDLDFAIDRITDLFAQPAVSEIGPTRVHWETYSRILREQKLVGDDIMDARIVAIAVEHQASVATSDKGFRRFSDYVKIVDPAAISTRETGRKK